MQVLGSGGPELNDRRASAGYLVWIDGHARLMIDAGGGTFARFGASGARFEDLDLVAFTHLHADHAAELPALLKSGYFSTRSRPLLLSGPNGGGDYPGLDAYLRGLIGPAHGAFRYLKGYLDGSDGLVKLERRTLNTAHRDIAPVFSVDSLSVIALGVTHGPVPALAYRVDYAGRSIVFSGDMNGDDPEFVAFTRYADLLIIDHAIPEDADPIAATLHPLPSEIGAIAQSAGVRHLLLSHLMSRSERVLETSLRIIERRFTGKISIAEDGMCIRL